QAGLALGTPSYMSPEQAAGRIEELGPASDIYGLGATLYCLLTGRAPIAGSDRAAILEGVQKGDFPPARQVNRNVPPGLGAVCEKAMALSPQDRYPSARSLADDVERWLADEPVQAYAEPWSLRARRWQRHHRTLVAAGAVGLVLLAAGGVVSAWL